MRERAEHADHAAEAVEQRHAEAQAIGRRQAEALAKPVAVVDDVAAREHHTFREARGARGVLHVDDVVDADGGLERVEIAGRNVAGRAAEIVVWDEIVGTVARR